LLNFIRQFLKWSLRFLVRIRKHVFRWKAFATVWYFEGQLILPKTCGLFVPISVNGKGRVVIGGRVHFGYSKAPKFGDGGVLLQARDRNARVTIGSRTITSNNISIVAKELIEIGEGCQIGDQVTIYDSDFHEIAPEIRNESEGTPAPVVIGKNVWLGSRVMVLKGVTIGDHSVIAAGSVVAKSIPARCLAAGIPARVIRDI
jgi:maltose O-acetyltransferase